MLDRWNDRERAEIAAAYAQHAPGALRLAYLLTADRAAAQDAVHEAFVTVAVRSLRHGSPEDFGAYLRRAVVNRVLADHRGWARRRAREEIVGNDRADPGMAFSDRTQPGPDVAVRHDLITALQLLPARQRAAVVLRYHADLSEAEIAERLGCRPGTVKSLLHRALARLREEAALDGYR